MSINTKFHSNTVFLAKTVLSSDAIAQAEANSLFNRSGALTHEHHEHKGLFSFIRNLNKKVEANPELAKPFNGFEKWVYVHHESTGLVAKIARVALLILPSLKEKITNLYRIAAETIDKTPLVYTFLNERGKENSHAALEAIKVNPESIKDIGKELAKEERFMLEALEANPACYTYMEEQWKNNPRVTLKAISLNGPALDQMGESLKNPAFYEQGIQANRDFYFQLDVDTQRKPSLALKILKFHPEYFQDVLDRFEECSPKLRVLGQNERWSLEELDAPVSRQEMIELAVLNCPLCWPYFPSINDKIANIIIKGIISNPARARLLPNSFMDNNEFMKALLNACPACYLHLEETVRNVQEYATIAFRKCPEMVQHLESTYTNEGLLTFAMDLNPDCYPYLNEEWRNNRVVSKKAISRKNELVAHLGSNLQTDVDYILDLVCDYPTVYPFLNNNLKNRPDVFLTAVKSQPNLVSLLSSLELNRNPEFIERPVEEVPRCYRYLDDVFKNISALALKAIEGDPAQAEFLPDTAEGSVIRQAIEQTPACYQYLSKKWKSMRYFAAIAIGLDVRLIAFIDESLNDNREFIKEMVSLYPASYAGLNDDWRNDEQLTLLAISKNRLLAREIGSDLLENEPFIKKLESLYPEDDTVREICNNFHELNK